MLRASILIGLSLITCQIAATEISDTKSLQLLTVNSTNVKQAIDFHVTLPASYYQSQNKRYPILLDLNPSSRLYLSGLNDWLSHNGQNPWLETIVVTPAKQHLELAALFDQSATPTHAEQLLSIIKQDLLAVIDKRYRTNGFRMYNGFMRSGTIGLYALLNQPTLFNAYIIATPHLVDNYLDISPQLKHKLPSLTDRVRILHLTYGDHRFEQPHLKAISQLTEELEQLAPAELEWSVNADKGHFMTRPITNLVNAVEVVFKDFHQNLAADSAISKRGAEAIVEYYEYLSEKKYGFEVPAERSLVTLANSMIDSSTPEALAIYQKITELYPDSAYAFHYLAAASVHVKDFNNALKYQRLAVEKSSNLREWQQIWLKQTLADYESKYD